MEEKHIIQERQNTIAQLDVCSMFMYQYGQQLIQMWYWQKYCNCATRILQICKLNCQLRKKTLQYLLIEHQAFHYHFPLHLRDRVARTYILAKSHQDFPGICQWHFYPPKNRISSQFHIPDSFIYPDLRSLVRRNFRS